MLDESLKAYLAETIESGKRVRQGVLVNVAASIILVAASWNVLPGNWMSTRVHQMERALAAMPKTASKALSAQEIELRRQWALDFRRKAQEMYLESLVVKIPFFGVAFDTNDIGWVGGISLVVISLMLRYSMKRHLVNCRLSFGEAEKAGSLRECYNILAMGQVLTVVPSEYDQDWKRGRWWPKLLFFPPVCATFLQVRFDASTAFVLQNLSDRLLLQYLGTTVLAAVCVAVLTASTLKLNLDCDNEWMSTASRALSTLHAPASSTDAKVPIVEGVAAEIPMQVPITESVDAKVSGIPPGRLES